MHKRLIKFLATLSLALIAMAAFAQSGNPFVGTWDIDFGESDFGGATVPQNLSRSYADLGDGNYMYQVATVNEDDTLSITSAHYTYSGEQYPIASFDELQGARISYRKINETTVEYTVSLEGEVTQIGAKFISPNYQRLTISIQFPNSDQQNQVLIFNRRR